MSQSHPILGSDFTGLFEGVLWWLVHGVYFVMLLITVIACMGRRTRATDDLTHSMVWGGIALLFTLALMGWSSLGRRPPDWSEFGWFARISFALWSAALALRWWHQRR